MSAILGRVHFDGAPIAIDSFHNAFAVMAEYGGDGANTWIEGPVGFGQHLLEVTPESRYEKQPHVWQNAMIVADARIDNRDELCDYFALPQSERASIPDSHLIVRAYRRWGEQCTAHLLGDFAFAIWDQPRRQLFCARDHIGARPLYFYHTPSRFLFATDIRALLAFADVDSALDEREIAQYLVWPQFPKEKTFFKHIYILQFGRQLIVDAEGIRQQTHWQPEDAPEIRYRATTEYVAHFRALLETAVADRVRTPYPVGAHISGGLDSSGVAILANRELRKAGRSLDMGYTWSPAKSETYPPVKGDERGRIEAICAQENIPCHYGTATAQDFRDFLARDIAVESITDVFEELPVMAHAGERNIRVMLSGWGGDEGATFDGRCYLAYLLKRGRLIHLLRIARREAGGLCQIRRFLKVLYWDAILPLLPASIYDRVDPMYRPDRHPIYIDPLFAKRVWGNGDSPRKGFRRVGDPREMQRALLQLGHLTDRMATWAIWSSAHRVVYCYPLADRRILNFALRLPRDLLYQHGKWRNLYRAALGDLLPAGLNKLDKVNERKRADQRLDCWRIFEREINQGHWNISKSPWLAINSLQTQLGKAPDAMHLKETLAVMALIRPIRIWYLDKYHKGGEI